VITPDENGNAYLYGSWTADSKIEFGESPVDGIVYGYKISTASSEGKSYAIRSNTATIYLNELGSFDNACAALESFARKYGFYDDNTPLVNFKIVGYHSYFYNSDSSVEVSIFGKYDKVGSASKESNVKTLDMTSCVNMTAVGIGEFNAFDNMTVINLPNDGEGFTSIGKYAFCGCSKLTNFVIPESVTSIGASAFQNCSKMTEVSIPASVTTIGSYAFYITGLTKVVCHVATPPTISSASYVFPQKSSSRYLYVPSASVDEYQNNSNWTKYFDTSKIIKIE
jgi:hypothetical protein